MAQLKVPSAPREYATHYHELLGVDFQADQTEVDRRRSPDMVNMISDFGGNPVKRDGYRAVVPLPFDSMVQIGDYVYAVFRDSFNKMNIAEVWMDGYELDGNDVLLNGIDVGDIKAVFTYKRTIYVVGTKAMFSYNVETGEEAMTGTAAGMMSTGTVGESAPATPDIVPDVMIDVKPDGTGGYALDDKNIMSIYQRISYKGDGTTTVYKIPTCQSIGAWVYAEVRNSTTGDWEPVAAAAGNGATAVYAGVTLDGESSANSTIASAYVTFTGGAPLTPTVAGQDNVRVTFAPFSMEEVYSNVYKGFYNEEFVKLLSCQAATIQSNRMFIADDYKVYYSDISDPFTISDLAWFEVDGEITAFTRKDSYLAVLTKDKGKSTIYLASEQVRTVDSATGAIEAYFTVKESNSGIGAIAPKCVASLSDEPLFLSNTGVYGILSNYMSEKYAVNRSARINRKLCQEPNLDKAVGIAFNDYFYLAINGRMYVLDGRHKESDRAGNKPFEAYYFEGLPAIENMWVVGDRMYFADDAKTYAWSDDLSDAERYFNDAYPKAVDGIEYQLGLIYNEETGNYYEEPTGEWVSVKPTPDENEVVWYKASFDDTSEEVSMDEPTIGDKKLTGNPVRARWCSAFDDDGAPQRLKTLMKKGSMVTLVPHFHSGCEITLVKDGDQFEYLGSFASTINGFDSIDFTQFTFNSNAVAFDNFTKKKVKKYKRLQIQIENNNAEPFGLTQITKTYIFGNYAKR